MKRRSFIKGLALGTVAGATLPLTSLGSEKGGQGSGTSRGPKDAFLEQFTQDSREQQNGTWGSWGRFEYSHFVACASRASGYEVSRKDATC